MSEIDPYERIKVEKIEREGTRHPVPSPPPRREKSLLTAAILYIAKKITDVFIPKTQSQKDLYAKCFQDLKKIKVCLEQLAKEDLSQDLEFLNSLSSYWLELLDDLKPYLQKKDPSIEKITNFRDQLYTYPQKEQYSLGYYLSEYAGYNWIPFPYMELLKKLHNQHLKNPHNSFLKNWITMIDDIIKTS